MSEHETADLNDRLTTGEHNRPSFLAEFREVIEQAQAALSVPEGLRQQIAHLVDVAHPAGVESLIEAGEIVSRHIRDVFTEAAPTNWHHLDNPVEMFNVAAKMREAIMWAPGPQVIDELLAADSSDRADLLLRRKMTVADDVAESAAQVSHPILTHPARMIQQAALAFRDGHWEAAQALASTTLTAVLDALHDGLSLRRRSARYQEQAKEWEEQSYLSLRQVLVRWFIGLALDGFDVRQGDSVPTRYNRHASVHTVDPAQYTEPNALSALLVANAYVHELELMETTGQDDPA